VTRRIVQIAPYVCQKVAEYVKSVAGHKDLAEKVKVNANYTNQYILGEFIH
jgi:hypothetical protein